MIQTPEREPLYGVRMLPKDLGVAIIVLIALLLGLVLRAQIVNRTKLFQDQSSPFRMAYPAAWSAVDSLQDVLLKVQDPQANSTFKTTLTIERRDIDPASPPDLQTLVDRRVAQRGELTGYHFLSNADVTVDGVTSSRLEYAYVVQPIDTPRRAALPVVVQTREYIVAAKDRTYYITLAAPENEFEYASGRLEQIIQTVHVQ